MILGIDHVVILVQDLAQASADYSSLGFTVVQGGEHKGGASHNALVSFADGSYLELISFRGPIPHDHLFYRSHGQEGPVTFALLPGNIAQDIEAARSRGLEIEGPLPGGRLRPDGQQISWELGIPATHDLPFLCGDVTPRELRVPAGQATHHANGVEGIKNITVAVSDLAESARRYQQLLGNEPEMAGTHAGFQLSHARITLVQPESGPVREYLEERGEGPYSLSLFTSANELTTYFDPALTHGALLEVVNEDIDAIGKSDR